MDKQYIKVQDHDNLFRDPETGAIVNKNKRPQNSLKEVLSSNTNDINTLKEEIQELKLLLLELVKKHG